MSELISLMFWPLIACLLLPWLLVYLGLHIVQRGIIFVDLALAQTAALGTCVGIIVGHDVHDWQNFACSILFTVFGAMMLTLTRTREQRVPQEALIGIIYIVAAAASILVLSHTTGGKEELQRSLVGELLVVPPIEVIKTFFLFLVIGGTHLALRGRFLAISTDPAGAQARGVNVRFWDFVFYLLFGLVVTSFVHIGGVLLTFSYLVIPAVCATYLSRTVRGRFLIGWGLATVAGVVSLFITAKVDLPIGAAIVCVLGLVLLVIAVVAPLLRNRSPRLG